MINSRGVDEFLWRGDPDAPPVQRMAAWIFGLAFMIVGLALLCIAHDKQSWIDIAVSLVSFLIGGKVFLNGFRRRKAKVSKIE
jgi:predicted tellurium resistance membrane protein TerC